MILSNEDCENIAIIIGRYIMCGKMLKKIQYNRKRFGLLYTLELFLMKIKIKKKLSTYAVLKRQKYYEELRKEDYEKELCELYRTNMGEEINLKNPVLFTEKIQWLILHDNTAQKSMLADKYLVRNWITDKIGDEYLIPIIGVWDDFENIDFDKLPNKFVLKCNHGSGYNYVIKDKSKMDYKKVKKTFRDWMKINFAFAGTLELQYAGIPRKIIAERYIEQLDGNLLDYKVHCFMGEPKYIQVIGDRDLERHTGAQMIFDSMWNEQMWCFADYPKFSRKIDCPSALNEMLDVSRKLSQEFVYVRIDFYIIDSKLKFGEMTFTPGSGLYRYDNNLWTRQENRMLGDLIDFSKVAV